MVPNNTSSCGIADNLVGSDYYFLSESVVKATLQSPSGISRSMATTIGKNMLPKAYQTIIIGGGSMGSSAAVHLALAGAKNICVVEKDPSYRFASSSLSASGLRQQFSLKENIQMSIYGANFLQNPSLLAVNDDVPDYQFFQNGYLMLSQAHGQQVLQESYQEQQRSGATWTQLLNQQELQTRFPWLNVHDMENSASDVVLGSTSRSNEGYFDPWSLVSAMKRKAVSLGVDYIHGNVLGGKFTGDGPTPTTYNIDSVDVELKGGVGGSVVTLKADKFVNAAGPWASKLVESLSGGNAAGAAVAHVPVEARKRVVFVVDCQPPKSSNLLVPPRATPLTVDPSGIWFRPEGQSPNCSQFIMGVSPPADKDPECHSDAALTLQEDDYSLFNDHVWPCLASRVPAFEYLKIKSAWAGFYEYNTLDQNAIIGYHSELSNLVLCNGFSGHGVQQAPAAGRAVSELILEGKSTSIDLSRFGFDRIVSAPQRPILESEVAIV